MQQKSRAAEAVRDDFLLAGLEGILQADGTVEHQMLGGRVLGIGAEVAQTHELEAHGCLGVLQALLHLAAGENLQRVGVQTSQEVLAGGIGIGIVKQIAVLTHFSISAVVCVHPVNGSTLDLSAVSGIAATGFGVIGSQNFHNVTVLVLNAAGTLRCTGMFFFISQV